MEIKGEVIAICSDDIRSESNANEYESAVRAALEAGKTIHTYWMRDPYYGGKTIAVDANNPRRPSFGYEPTARLSINDGQINAEYF